MTRQSFHSCWLGPRGETCSVRFDPDQGKLFWCTGSSDCCGDVNDMEIEQRLENYFQVGPPFEVGELPADVRAVISRLAPQSPGE